MRLIDVQALARSHTINFRDFTDNEDVQYAILSHRWGDQEVTYQELTNPNVFLQNNTSGKGGWHKLRSAAIVADDYRCEWLWCDTCCINKESSAELSEAINSMYLWYQKSYLCFAYLADVSKEDEASFIRSVWFDRSWTLQELIAPQRVIFFDQLWRPMDNKHDLAGIISERTGIDKDVLLLKKRLDKFTVAQKMSWATNRQASRTEDIAYSLLGIFGVNMPMLYGERERAFIRLQEEIIQRNADQSIFMWSSSTQSRDLFASSPADFKDCGDLHQQDRRKKAFTVNNLGLDIELTLSPTGLNSYVAYLAVESGGPNYVGSLNLEIDPETGYLCRTDSSLRKTSEKVGSHVRRTQRITVLRSGSSRNQTDSALLFGFHLQPINVSLVLVNSWDPAHRWDAGEWSRGPSPDDFQFSIPDGASGSIAMLKMFMGHDVFLIQLTYDFDFNPCCHVSRMTLDFSERFRRRNFWEVDDKMFDWTETTPNWSTNLRHLDIKFNDPNTDQPCWAAKAIDRQEFTAIIPTSVTKPHRQLEASFSCRSASTREWTFKIENNHPIPTLRHKPGDISIVDLRAEIERDTLMRIDSTEEEPQPAPWVRQPSYREVHNEAKLRKGPLGAVFLNKRTDTSPT